MSAALATTEQQRLVALEATIERGLATFVEVGEALMEIRDARLYRPHQTFEDYCRDWSRGYQLLRSGRVMELLENFPTKPDNDAQARELAPLLPEPETLREAWAEVVELHPDPGMGVHSRRPRTEETTSLAPARTRAVRLLLRR